MAMMQGDMMKCYMMRMYEVKPECRDLWRMEFPKCKMMWEKHGAKCMGMWQVCLGGSCMYMMMMEFPNMMTAMKCQMGIRCDPEHTHMCQMMYKCVDKITCPIMKCMPVCPMTMPSPNSNICMMRFTLKTMPCMAMKDCQSFMTKFCEMFCKPCGMKMIGCFVPCMTLTCNSMYMMMEMPEEKTMDCMAKMEEFCMMCCSDPAKCDMMMPFYNHCSGYSMKMMNPCCMNMGQMTMGMDKMMMGQMGMGMGMGKGMDQQMCGMGMGKDQQMCM